jgi:hypothetical protein
VRAALLDRRADAADRAQAVGATEPFARDKAIAGVRKACKGRPVTEDQLDCLGQAVEDALRTAGHAEVPAHEVGMAILSPLRQLDEVAYLRFASVYRQFESADDFESEIAMLRMERVGFETVASATSSTTGETVASATSSTTGETVASATSSTTEGSPSEAASGG